MMTMFAGYFEWLCDMVHVDQEERSYWLMAKDLYNRKFYSLIPHDENRACDGKQLREEYLEEYGYSDRLLDISEECSVLEMLIGLARRMDFETGDPYEFDGDSEKRMVYWFWELIDNLGLLSFDDESYVEFGGMTEVDRIIDNFLERQYASDGVGGLFPLNNDEIDQRDVEIWYQMSMYLAEMEAV